MRSLSILEGVTRLICFNEGNIELVNGTVSPNILLSASRNRSFPKTIILYLRQATSTLSLSPFLKQYFDSIGSLNDTVVAWNATTTYH